MNGTNWNVVGSELERFAYIRTLLTEVRIHLSPLRNLLEKKTERNVYYSSHKAGFNGTKVLALLVNTLH